MKDFTDLLTEAVHSLKEKYPRMQKDKTCESVSDIEDFVKSVDIRSKYESKNLPIDIINSHSK